MSQDSRFSSKATTRFAWTPVAPANPYWAEHRATYQDPDGLRVVRARALGTVVVAPGP